MSKEILTFMVILIAILLLSSCQNSSDLPAPPTTSTINPPTVSSTSTVSSDIPQPVPTQTEKGVAFLSDSAYLDNNGYFHVIGEVKNDTSSNVRQIKINVSLIDTLGDIISTRSNLTFLSLLEPQQVSPFEVIFQEIPDEILNYQMELSWQVTDDTPKARLQIQQISTHLDEEGYYWVVGEIQNIGSQTLDLVAIFGSFYDSDGRIIAVASSFPDVIPLSPGALSSFTLAVEVPQNTTIQESLIQAEAY